MYNFVKKYDDEFSGAGKPNEAMLNEDGTPKIFYHGTDAKFTTFDRTKGRSTMDIQGMFFSPWELDAQGYGSNVGAYNLNIKNPAQERVAYRALNRFKGQNNAGAKATNVCLQDGGKFTLNTKKAPTGRDSRVSRYGQGTTLPTVDASNQRISELNPDVKQNLSRAAEDSEGEIARYLLQ